MAHSSDPRSRNPQDETVQGNNNKRRFSKDNSDETWISEIYSQKNTAEEQLSLILVEIEAGFSYYRNVHQIQVHLTKTLQKERILKIEPFGSAITKLALKNSDVDIFLDFGDKLPDSPKKFVRTLRNKIGRYKFFYKPVAILARVPIVQCVHKSGISCDISFINGLGVSNSNLIRFLLSLDERIRPMILVLKYLFKKKGLVGSNALTSYALTMLVVYFVQQLEQPILPSISHMQHVASLKESVTGWNTSFTTDPTLLPSITNQECVTELLHKFFKFYSTFEFGFYVISVFTAGTYLKNLFAHSDLLPEQFSCYKENLKQTGEFQCNKHMCVQGPFNHSHNITRNVSSNILREFQNFCSESMKICPELNQTETHKSEYFLKLFSQLSENKKNMRLKENTHVALYVGDGVDLTNPNLSENDIRAQWVENILNFVSIILTNVMKCKIQTHTKDSYKSTSTFIPNEEILKVFECEMFHFDLVTKKRNEAKKDFQFPKDMDSIKQEELISDFLCETILKDKAKLSLKFDIICTISKSPTCAFMYLECKEETTANKNYVLQIFQFIKYSFPKWIK